MLDEPLLHLLHARPWPAFAFFLALNLGVFALALLAGEAVRRLFRSRRVSAEPGPIEPLEAGLALCTVLLNTAVAHAGWLLWRAGLVSLPTHVGASLPAWLEGAAQALGLALVMDALMYVTHRLAHHRLLFALLHAPHHRYVNVRPLTLFVLHPAETLAFGALWLVVLVALQPGWLGVVLYLSLNTVFGVLGHTGVEPLPPWFEKVPVLGLVTGGGFHARHHADKERNFGFYTKAWDKLFSTGTD